MPVFLPVRLQANELMSIGIRLFLDSCMSNTARYDEMLHFESLDSRDIFPC
jgi:hypothetical protein